MNLSDIPTVVVDSRGGYKYIVAQLSSGEYYSKVRKLVIRANQDYKYHKNILDSLRDELRNSRVKVSVSCIGGGVIRVNPDAQTIHVSERSGDYGKDDRAVTMLLLGEAFPDWEVFEGEPP